MTITREFTTAPCGDPTCCDGYCKGHAMRIEWVETADIVTVLRDGEPCGAFFDWELDQICQVWAEMRGHDQRPDSPPGRKMSQS